MSETGPVFFYEPEFYMLSNFSAHAFFFKGIFYPTAEHAYQAGKFHDEHDKAHIQGAISPSIAKKRSKSRQADIGLRNGSLDVCLVVLIMKLPCLIRMLGSWIKNPFEKKCVCREVRQHIELWFVKKHRSRFTHNPSRSPSNLPEI
jgi:hypothetical protein